MTFYGAKADRNPNFMLAFEHAAGVGRLGHDLTGREFGAVILARIGEGDSKILILVALNDFVIHKPHELGALNGLAGTAAKDLPAGIRYQG